MLAICNVM